MHAVISHRSRGNPLTVEGAIVRVADALDMAKGRSRVGFEAGDIDIHSLSAYAIEEVRILPGEDKAVRIEIEMSNSAGIFQVDEGLGTKLRGTPLEEHIEVVAASRASTRSASSRCSGCRPRSAQRRAYQCTPFMRLAIATCSIDAFSSGSFLPLAAAESGKTL